MVFARRDAQLQKCILGVNAIKSFASDGHRYQILGIAV